MRTLLPILALLAAPAAAAAQAPFTTDRCPVPPEVRGYPVSLAAADGAPLDSAFARAFVEAAARRWEPPSARRREHAGIDRVADRLVPPAPLWPDDWRPGARHAAVLAFTAHRDGRIVDAPVVRSSDDRAFNVSLSTILDEPRAGPFPLPAPPADSVRLLLRLGEPPAPGDAATIRFAAQQSPVRVVPGTLNVVPPAASRAPGATVKYDVDEAGRVIPSSIQVLRRSDASFGRAVEEGLRRARFTPARADCRVIPRSVVQVFGERG